MFEAVVFIYLISMMVIGLLLRKRVKLASDFLVAGRKLGLPLTTATLAAVQLGAGVVLGGAELGARSGVWPGMWYGLGCGGGLILAGLLVAAKLKTDNGYVPLDYFANRYGEKKWIRIWGWLSNIPSLLGIFVAQLMAAGTIFSLFGFSFTEGVIISGLVIMIYSLLSGMWGVVVTDFVQLGIIFIGIPIVAIAAILKLADLGTVSLTTILSTPFIPDGMSSKAVFIIIPFFLSISVSYDAFMRYQSAKSASIAKNGCIIAGIIVILISFCTGLIGAIGRIIFPALAPHEIMPRMITFLLSPALAGLVVSALLAAAMSSGNCLLLSLSACFSRDLYNKVFNPSAKLDDLKYSIPLSRIVIVCAVIAGILIAFKAKSILYTIIIFNYPYMGSMLIPLLGGVLWKKGNPKGAIAAIFAGGIIGLLSFFWGVTGPANGSVKVDLGLMAAYLVSALVFILVSLYTGETEGKGGEV